MKKTFLILAGTILLATSLAQAGPAPWYQWRSKADGQLACAQTSLGSGWAKFSGPYRDARCEFRIPAK
jgi:hypothetical protein